MNDTTQAGDRVIEPWLPNDDIARIWDWQEIFGNGKPVELELGAGDGGFILEYAAQHPERNFVAIERLKGRACKIAKRTVQRGLRNLKTLRLQSEYVVERMCPAGSVTVIHIMFPDPWPKRRHFKNRLIQPAFLQAAHRALCVDGLLRFTTDHESYFLWSQRVVRGAPGWERVGAWDASQEPKSDFERLFENEGRSFHRDSWRKVAGCKDQVEKLI